MNLINLDYVKESVNSSKWCESHGASETYLGAGLLYYTLTYIYKSMNAVCLGSGGGFVPRLMRQAQLDLGLKSARTILIDGNQPEAGWGSPDWISRDSFFRKSYPDIEIRIESTREAFKQMKADGCTIDYLHIDADHSLDGCWTDFAEFSQFLAPNGIITFHDTGHNPDGALRVGVPYVIARLRTLRDWDVVDFKHIGCGTALVKRAR